MSRKFNVAFNYTTRFELKGVEAGTKEEALEKARAEMNSHRGGCVAQMLDNLYEVGPTVTESVPEPAVLRCPECGGLIRTGCYSTHNHACVVRCDCGWGGDIQRCDIETGNVEAGDGTRRLIRRVCCISDLRGILAEDKSHGFYMVSKGGYRCDSIYITVSDKDGKEFCIGDDVFPYEYRAEVDVTADELFDTGVTKVGEAITDGRLWLSDF